MSLGKRALTWPLTHALLAGWVALYRFAVVGGVRWRSSRRLRALMRSGRPALFATWHQDFLTSCGWLSRWGARRRTYALASASRDGGLAATMARAVGFRPPVRGSSARGGRRALLAMHRLLEREPDASLVIVCDGPRPPARRLQPGVLHLASRSGRELWLLRTAFRPHVEFRRSWARFRLPLPWGRALCLADGPIHLPPALGRAERERWRAEVEGRLERLAARADALLGRPIQGSGS